MDHNVIISDRALEKIIDVFSAYIDLYSEAFSKEELEDDDHYHSCKKIAISFMLARKHDKEYIDCCNMLTPNYVNLNGGYI